MNDICLFMSTICITIKFTCNIMYKTGQAVSHKTFDFGNHADSQQKCSLSVYITYNYTCMFQGLAAYACERHVVCNLQGHTFPLFFIWAPHLLLTSHLVQNPGQMKHCRYRQVQGQSQFYTLLKPWRSNHQVQAPCEY